MNFDTKHNVENNVFTTTVSFTSFGTSEMDEQHELALFNDLGYPKINLGEIKFEGVFKVDADKRVIDAAGDDIIGETADKVSFIQNAKIYELDNKFTVSYSIDARDIAESEVGAVLNTKKLVAEAKALLFQEKLYEAIAAAVTAIKAERTRFETDIVPTLTV